LLVTPPRRTAAELEIVRAALDHDSSRETGVAGLSCGTLYGTPGKISLQITGKFLKKW
jgi:hypothetical protein